MSIMIGIGVVILIMDIIIYVLVALKENTFKKLTLLSYVGLIGYPILIVAGIILGSNLF